VTPSDHQAALHAAVKLTSQRDQESLAGVLVEALTTLTGATNISVYHLGGELGRLSAKVLASSNPHQPAGSHLTPLESRRSLKTCIDTKQKVVHEQNERLKIIHPVLEQGIVVGMLTQEYPQQTHVPEALIQALLSIYSNQHSLLNHQQRDGLTGLFNRSALQNWLNKALGEKSRENRRLADATLGCFALFDIDFFKRINDSRGHLYGDEVLLTFADLMRESFRFNDLLFRYGGEEFAAILNDTELDDALSVLERFRSAVSQYRFTQLNQVTVTIGVARITPRLDPAVLIERADKALYYGKQHGRNQVNAYEWLEQGHIIPALDDRPHTIKLF
jgi:diguanylate cyclase (GGDEF)-like protein